MATPRAPFNKSAPLSPPPPPPLKRLGQFLSGPSADQTFALAPLAPICLDEKFSLALLAPLKPQHHLRVLGGGGGAQRAPPHRQTGVGRANPRTVHRSTAPPPAWAMAGHPRASHTPKCIPPITPVLSRANGPQPPAPRGLVSDDGSRTCGGGTPSSSGPPGPRAPACLSGTVLASVIPPPLV